MRNDRSNRKVCLTGPNLRAAGRSSGGFTLIEVLAALAFMAIVIPVAVEGLRVANQAGEVGERKAAAVRVAEFVLNKAIVTGTIVMGSQSGTLEEGAQSYQWSIRIEPWSMDAMNLATAQVTYTVQGRPYQVSLTTLTSPSSL